MGATDWGSIMVGYPDVLFACGEAAGVSCGGINSESVGGISDRSHGVSVPRHGGGAGAPQ